MATTAVISLIVIVWVASASDSAGPRPGVHNGIITACVEPATKGNRATSGDLNLLVCLKGAKKIVEHQKRAARTGGPAGAQGAQGRQARRVRRAIEDRRCRGTGACRPARTCRAARSSGATRGGWRDRPRGREGRHRALRCAGRPARQVRKATPALRVPLVRPARQVQKATRARRGPAGATGSQGPAGPEVPLAQPVPPARPARPDRTPGT